MLVVTGLGEVVRVQFASAKAFGEKGIESKRRTKIKMIFLTLK